MREDFGRLLRHHRDENNLTRQQLIEKLCEQGYPKFDKSTISRWENGQRRPRVDVVETLEDVLNIRRGLLLRAAHYPVDVEYARDEDVILAHLKDMNEILHFITPQWLEVSTTEMEPPEDLTDDQLRSGFYYRLEQARMKYGDKKVACLTSHLRAYFPSIEYNDIEMLLEKEPHNIYEQLWLIGQRGINKGTCSICKA